MTHRSLRVALGLAVVLLIHSSPAAAQGLASIAAANAGTAATTVEKAGAGCWGCVSVYGYEACIGGTVPGYFNCTAAIGRNCVLSSPGCGAGAALPLDPDGASQFVSRGSRLGILAQASADESTDRRNCEGIVVARKQTVADIAEVRNRTGLLTL